MIEFRAMVLLMFAALIATTVGVLTYLSGQPPAAGLIAGPAAGAAALIWLDKITT
ncbi:hypothetical protein [Nocardia beijingensis]